MKTYSPKAREITRDWHVVDATGQTLGRLAAEVASLLRGKHKPTYSPHLDMGDYVVVVNSEKIRVTGRKRQQKMYYRHSMYPGGLKVESLDKLLARRPARVIERAVRGMLPHNRLGRQSAADLADLLREPRPAVAGPAAPPQGLCLMKVNYPGLDLSPPGTREGPLCEKTT